MLTHDQFIRHLRSALNHLYDLDHLRRNPLTDLFDVADRINAPAALQRILIEAIEELEPEADEPPHSHTWGIYETLYYRYVQQWTRQQVADQLGISPRQLTRKQRVAQEALTKRLCSQFDPKDTHDNSTGTEAVNQENAVVPEIHGELAWLKDTPLVPPTDLRQALVSIAEQARPMAAQHDARLTVSAPKSLPTPAMHQLALKQALLNLLSVAIHSTSGHQVTISARARQTTAQPPSQLDIEIQCTAKHPLEKPATKDDRASLDIAHYLAELYECGITVSTDAGFSAKIIIPVLEQLPVLVIDDNADSLQLLQRYTSQTRYRLIGTRDPEQALNLAEKTAPQIIVLDVMMPRVDGWELLTLLRQNPITRHIPIIVCTILPQEDMALSMGASGFVRKPITRQTFLAALDEQARDRQPAQLVRD